MSFCLVVRALAGSLGLVGALNRAAPLSGCGGCLNWLLGSAGLLLGHNDHLLLIQPPLHLRQTCDAR